MCITAKFLTKAKQPRRCNGTGPGDEPRHWPAATGQPIRHGHYAHPIFAGYSCLQRIWRSSKAGLLAAPLHPTFLALHILANPDVAASVKLATRRFVCFGFRRNKPQWPRARIWCHRVKVQQHSKALLTKFSETGTLVEHLPLPCGYSYLFTCVDRLTCWWPAIPISFPTSEQAA